MTTTKKKYNNVGLSPATDKKLSRVCKHRGWKKTEAISRMTDRELDIISHEQQSARPQP